MNTLTANTLNNLIEDANNLNYVLKIDKEKLTAILDKISPRSKLGFKRVFAYRFSNLESLVDYVKTEINYIKDAIERKESKKRKNLELEKSIYVGDVFHASWGYGMCLNSYYEVIARKGKKSVVVRELNTEVTRVIESGFRYYVKPIKGSYRGDEQTFRLNGDSIKIESFMHGFKMENTDKESYTDKND